MMENKKQARANAAFGVLAKKLLPSEADARTLSGLAVDPAQQADDFFDYSKAVVRKPWGYEYLIYQNSSVAVWVLHIKKGHATSIHCHPGKKAAHIILSGEAVCSTLEGQTKRSAGEGIVFGRGVFHRTRAVSPGGAFMMEIETPVNKRDLVRFKDEYGREKLGYEGSEHLSFNLNNYNYISLIDQSAYYNVKRKFGNCSFELVRLSGTNELRALLSSSKWDIIGVLKGRIFDRRRKVMSGAGDTFDREHVSRSGALTASGKLEVMVIKKLDTMTRLSDFIVSHLKRRGIKDFFFVPETSSAHLIDAIGRDTEIRGVSLRTDRAVTLAAEAYSKLTNRPCAAILSSGASGTSALTGVADAWVDSVPFLVISGQSRFSELGRVGGSAIRQLANKELDIVGLVKPVTKYSAAVQDPAAIKRELDHAISFSTSGRCGPVWLDIPIDVLGANIDESKLAAFSAKEGPAAKKDRMLAAKTAAVLKLLKSSRRPVMLAGHGVRAAGAQAGFIKLAKALSIPVLTSRRAIDLIPEDFPLYFGRPGTYGQRAANFIVQNADFVLCVGSRLSLPLIGRNYRAFARAAKKAVVDIDPQELEKATVTADIAINAGADEFIGQMLSQLPGAADFRRDSWIKRCRLWRSRFLPGREAGRAKSRGVDPYYFVDVLSRLLARNDIIVADGGPSLDYVMQCFRLKAGQRVVSSPGLEYQGFALPAAIGACLADNRNKIICLCGKKGLELNVSEIQVIIKNKLPIKVFVFNNKGYSSVKQVQAAYFGGRYVGDDGESAADSLNVRKLGDACGFRTEVISRRRDVGKKIKAVLASGAPVLCEITLPVNSEIIPRLAFTVKPDGRWVSKPLEDMYPLLSRKRLRENMIVGVLDED
ncbi:MAG: thiamine pyrophosphate-dependent enzyme [Elusimicrobiota bacterium]